jgi:hypothetical protein
MAKILTFPGFVGAGIKNQRVRAIGAAIRFFIVY